MKKKVSYIQLLKEAISEYDTKSLDYKSPMIEPILGFDGNGEMETNRDASSILERYYFKEKNSDKFMLEQDVQEEEPEENEVVTGEEPDDVDETMDDLENELTEDFDLMLEDDEEGEEPEGVADVPEEFEKEEGEEAEGVAEMETAIIEKLIGEMEEQEDEETDGGEAGTDLASDEEIDKVTEDLELEMLMLEAEEETEVEDEKEDKEDKEDLDVDDEISENGLGPIISAKDEIEEAFRLFKEQVEETDETETDETETDETENEEDLEESLFLEDEDVEDEDVEDEDVEDED